MDNRLNYWIGLVFILVAFVACDEEDEPIIENNVPIVNVVLNDVNLQEGVGEVEISVANTFKDEDDDVLSYDVSSSDEGVATVSVSGSSITIVEEGPGSTTITVVADDGNEGTVSDMFVVTISAEEVNNAPTVKTPIDDVALDQGFVSSSIDIANTFADIDGDDLSYAVSSSDVEVIRVEVKGLKIILTEVGIGTANVEVIANDGNEGVVSELFVVTVSAEEVNNAPTVETPIDGFEIVEGFSSSTIDISSTFSDIDGDDLTYDVSSSDMNVLTATVSGTTITLTEVGIGTANVTVNAYDNDQASVSDVFTVTITESSDNNGEALLTFGSNTGSSINIQSWQSIDGALGYVVVVSDESGINDRVDGEEALSSTTYLGTGEQVIYVGSTSEEIDVMLLEDDAQYYFKVFPYTGDFLFTNDYLEQNSTTASCSINSTSESQVCFDYSVDNVRTISSNQYPSHAVGSFPNADPTAIQSTRSFNMSPTVAGSVTYVYNETGGATPQNKTFYQFGMAINGVEFHPMGLKPWTNPSEDDENYGEENWKWQAKVTEENDTGLDAYGAHVTTQGNYHYHGDIYALASDEDGSRHSLIYGFAGDGFPIYYKYGYTISDDPSSGIVELQSSYEMKSGARTGTGTAGEDFPDGDYDGTYIQDFEYGSTIGDLDECNGRTGVTPEYPDGTYYYVITADFPVTPNCFVGTPDDDWLIGR
ncbi:MAG: YHYH protein [Reichenbachiella sp.]